MKQVGLGKQLAAVSLYWSKMEQKAGIKREKADQKIGKISTN